MQSAQQMFNISIRTILRGNSTSKKIKQIQSYSTKGQIGYISPQERFSSRFEWQYQTPKAYKLKLYSLISKTTLTMEMHPNGMTISDNKGNQQSDKKCQIIVTRNHRNGCAIRALILLVKRSASR